METQQRSWLRANCIGRGSFGTVSLAVHKSDGHLFAVKSVEHTSSPTSSRSSQLNALENEIKIVRSLSSPYVVKYLGDDVSYENSTTSYRNLHLEYMPGGTAADLAEFSGGDVDEGIIRSVTSCVVSALKYVHSLGIVHCDVKGRNVLVGSSCGTAKLADFGSAVELKESVVLPRGSPLWMAPEVIRGECQGPEADVWSLGCTVIEMVTGRPAWEDKGLDTVSRIGYSDELPKFPTRLSQLGHDFLDKCLRRNRLERWSCDQLLQHPFLMSSCPSNIADVSPRCTLDWFNHSFSDEDDDHHDQQSHNFQNFNFHERIDKLALKTGAIWEESDGWLDVRSSNFEEQQRAIMEYPDIIREENSDTGEDSWVTKNEYLNLNINIINMDYYNNSVLLSALQHNNFTDNFTARKDAGSSCPRGFQRKSCSYYCNCNVMFHSSLLYNNCFFSDNFKDISLYINKILCFAFVLSLLYISLYRVKYFVHIYVCVEL